MSFAGRRRDEDMVRALRAQSERRWQARRQRRALIAKVGLCVGVLSLSLATAAALITTRRPLPHAAPPVAPETSPLITPLPSPTCPTNDGLEDDARVEPITHEFQALRATMGRIPADCEGTKTCGPTANKPITRAIQGVRDRFARCAAAAPSSLGKITVRAVVAPNGLVARTHLKGTFVGTAVGRCVAAAVATEVFSPASEGLTVELPFLMQPSDARFLGCPETVTARRLRLLSEAVEAISRSCDGPRARELCSPDAFATTFSERLPIIERNRATAELWWLRALENGDPRAAYGLGWLRSRKALPELRRQLLDHVINPSTDSDLDPFVHAMALSMAIEHIARRPLRRAVTLTPGDRRRLREISIVRGSDACFMPADRRIARWLLHKLDGVPMRDPARDLPSGIRCRPGSTVAIWR